MVTHRLRSPSLSGSTADGRGVRGARGIGENSPSATSRDGRPSATVPECIHPPGILLEIEMVDRWRVLGTGRGSMSASSSSTTEGRLQMISFDPPEHYHTYSSTPPLLGKTVSRNTGRTISGLGVEYNFAVPTRVIEGFGTNTGGGSYLDPTAFSEELWPSTFSVESCKGDPSLKEAGRPVCEEVRAGGVASF